MSGKQTRPQTQAAPAPEVAEVNPYQQNYEGLYGSRLGGKAWDLVDEQLSPDKIDGYAADGFSSLGGYIGGLAEEHAEEGDGAAATAFREHLELSFGEGYGQRFADTDISENIHAFAGDNPWVLGAGAALGLGAAYAADVDLEFDTDFDLGDNWEVMLGGDFGSAQDIGMDGASAGLEWHNDTSKLGLEGSMDFTSDDWQARLYGSHRFESGGLLDGHLAHEVSGDTSTTDGRLGFHQPGAFAASLTGSHLDGPESYTSLNAGIRTDWGEQNPWSLEAGAGWDSRTGTSAFAGANYEHGDTSFNAGVSHDEQNGTMGTIGFSHRF